MQKKFKFTNAKLSALKSHDSHSKSTDLELSDDGPVSGLKLLIGKTGNKRFLLRYIFQSKKTSIALGKFGDIDVATARKIAQKLHTKIAEGIDPKAEKDSYKTMPSISEFFWTTYLPVIKVKKRSWKDDEQRFRQFIDPILGPAQLKTLKAIDVLHLQQRIADPIKMGRQYAPSTNNRIIAILKTLMGYALKLGLVDINVSTPISLLKEDNIRERFFDIEQTKKIIAAALAFHNPYTGSAIAMLYICGNRRSEVFNLKWSNLNREKRTILVEHSKSGKPYTIYLSSLSFQIITNLHPIVGNPYIFAGRKQGQPVKQIRKAYHQILAMAGITDLEGVCFHTARHSVASNMISSGKFSQVHVKQQLAHSSIQSSERYIKHTPSSARNISEGFAELIKDWD